MIRELPLVVGELDPNIKYRKISETTSIKTAEMIKSFFGKMYF